VVPLISCVTGAAASELGEAHWRAHAREPLRFGQALGALVEGGAQIVLELGPAPTAIPLAGALADRALWLPLLDGGPDDWQPLLHALGALWVRGVPVDWERFDRGHTRQKVSVPTYPFERAPLGSA
jgi:acyl transferase domain-containing protein